MSITIHTTPMNMNLIEDLAAKAEENAVPWDMGQYFDLDENSIVVYQQYANDRGFPVGLVSADLVLIENNNVLLRMNVQEYIDKNGILYGQAHPASLLVNGGFLPRLQRYIMALQQAGIVGGRTTLLDDTASQIRTLLTKAYGLAAAHCPKFEGTPPTAIVFDLQDRI